MYYNNALFVQFLRSFIKFFLELFSNLYFFLLELQDVYKKKKKIFFLFFLDIREKVKK